MIYFDNAATSFPKPQCVINEVISCIKKYGGNPGRSSHSLAIAAANKIYDARETISEFLSVGKSENIVFTPNATYALNLAIKGTVNKKCHCITSDMEHNSVLRPLHKAIRRHGGSLSVYDSSLDLEDAIIPLIKSDTSVIVSTIASNVTGKILDINKLSDIASRYNLKLIIDASQFTGHRPLDLSNVNYSVLCSAGHKALFGIQGSGFAVFKKNDLIDTLTEGGSGIDTFSEEMPLLLPERYEAGTLSTPGIASLAAGVKYIQSIGLNTVEEHLNRLTDRTADMLSSIQKATVYGAENGILSFNILGYTSSALAGILNRYGIATRSGFHCAPLMHKKLGTEMFGSVRISLSYFNTAREIDFLHKTLKEICFLA